jgi:hypothetical protein
VEGGALPGSRLHPNLTMMCHDNLIANVESQPGAGAGGIFVGHAVEPLENHGLMFQRNAGAVICEADVDRFTFLCQRHLQRGAGCVLDGVAEKVLEDARQVDVVAWDGRDSPKVQVDRETGVTLCEAQNHITNCWVLL